MRLKELSQLYYLSKEIEMDQQRLEELRSRAESPSSPVLTGMPINHTNESRVERYAIKIVDLEAIIAKKQQQCIYERNRLEQFIGDIDDSLTRQIFTLRCVHGQGWLEIADNVGGGNTCDGVRMRFYRHLKKVKTGYKMLHNVIAQ